MKILKRLREKIRDKAIKKKLKKKFVSETETKSPAQSSQEVRIGQTKFYTGTQAPQAYPAFPQELPVGYGRDRIVLQTRDPWWVHAYWELTTDTWHRLQEQLKDLFYQAKKVLRTYDVSFIIFDGTNAHRYFDIEINDQTNNWYIDTGGPGRSWCVDLGLNLPDGRFITIMRSNTVQTPLEGPSGILDEEWMVPEDMFARLYGMGVGLGMSSPVGKGWQEKVRKKAFMPQASIGISSVSSPVKRIPQEKGFRLIVNTELIVYGATEPDAKLEISGQAINLRPDGTFSLRFSLPDGKHFLPVKAISSDGRQERTITPIVTKETK